MAMIHFEAANDGLPNFAKPAHFRGRVGAFEYSMELIQDSLGYSFVIAARKKHMTRNYFIGMLDTGEDMPALDEPVKVDLPFLFG